MRHRPVVTLDRIEARLQLLKWMCGGLLGLSGVTLGLVFAIWVRLGG